MMEFVNGRQEGYGGLLSLLREMQTGEWARKHLFVDPKPQVAEMRRRYAEEIDRCMDELFDQCTDEELLKLVEFYVARPFSLISHAGLHCATFIDMVWCASEIAYQVLTVENLAKEGLESATAQLFSLDVDYLTGGVANELRLVRSWRTGGSGDDPPQTGLLVVSVPVAMRVRVVGGACVPGAEAQAYSPEP